METFRSKIPQPLLRVLSRAYGFLTGLRNAFYDVGILKSFAVDTPIVCVGNLSAGGNAKTPLVRYLVEALQQRGLAPVILSRGYGGKCKGPYSVEPSDSASSVGDEPLMLRRLTNVPVVIARKRLQGARFIEKEQLGTVILLDDGFQHRRLRRNLDILVVNISSDRAIEAFLSGDLLPAGNFREERYAGLKRAHMLVFADRRIASEPKNLPAAVFASLPEHLQLYRAFLKNAGVEAISHSGELAVGAEVVIFTGIANPEGFVESVKGLGLQVKEIATFADHHLFTQQDIDRVQKRFPETPLLCTEKDLVKLEKLKCSSLFVLRTRMEVVPSDAFSVQVMKGLRKAPRGTVVTGRKESEMSSKQVAR